MVDWGERESLMSSDLSAGTDEPGEGPSGRASSPQDDFDFPALVSIADTLPIMIAYCDTEQRYRFVNRPIAEWFGRPRSEILGRKVEELMSPQAYEARRGAIEKALSGTPQQLSAEYDHPEFGRSFTKATYRPHRDASGRVAGLVMVVENVTERRRTERELLAKLEEGNRALADHDARMHAIFDAVQTVIVLMTPDGKIIETNERATPWRPNGGQPDVGHHIWETPTAQAFPDDLDDLRGHIAKAAAGETIVDERELRSPDRPTTFLQSTFQPIFDDDGAVRFILMEARDMSDLKIAQDQLRQAQKMEALGQLTGGIAHDFNNLLTVVVGGLDMITRRDLDDKTRAYAVNALAAAERGARLTGQLLAFSRTQKIEVQPCDVAELIDNARPLLRNVLGPGIEKAFDLDEKVSPAMADPTQLEVALLNLAVNARDAMSAGGCLTFSVKSVLVEDEDPELSPGRYIELAVADTGDGMPEEVRSRVFEPFFTTKAIGKGTGLGLSMVYGMARQSGGTARIQSAPGEGTRVSILLRCADEDMVPINQQGCVSGRGAPCTGRDVLVVDDDPAVRTFIVESLNDCGCRPREAADGREALAMVAQRRPDLVILDYIMPGMSGAEVAQSLLEKDPDQPILFVSGYSETNAIRAAAPNAAILAKPFRSEALIEMIEELISSDN